MQAAPTVFENTYNRKTPACAVDPLQALHGPTWWLILRQVRDTGHFPSHSGESLRFDEVDATGRDEQRPSR
jgi:hypothetical protein